MAGTSREMARRCFCWLLRTINKKHHFLPRSQPHPFLSTQWKVLHWWSYHGTTAGRSDQTGKWPSPIFANGWVERIPSNICYFPSRLLNSSVFESWARGLEFILFISPWQPAPSTCQAPCKVSGIQWWLSGPYPWSQSRETWQTRTQSSDTEENVKQEGKQRTPSGNCTGFWHFYRFQQPLKPPAKCQHKAPVGSVSKPRPTNSLCWAALSLRLASGKGKEAAEPGPGPSPPQNCLLEGFRHLTHSLILCLQWGSWTQPSQGLLSNQHPGRVKLREKLAEAKGAEGPHWWEHLLPFSKRCQRGHHAF